MSQETRTEARASRPKNPGWPIDGKLLESFLDQFFHPRTIVLPWEGGERYERLRFQLVTELKPADRLQKLLVDQIAVLMWRLKRSYRFETGLLVGNHLALAERVEDEQGVAPNIAYDLTDFVCEEQAQPSPAVGPAQTSENRSAPAMVDEAAAFALGVDREPLAKLQKYQKGLEDSLYRAIRELQKLQAPTRGDSAVPASLGNLELDVIDEELKRRARARRNVRSRSGPGGAGAQHVVGQTKGNLQPKQ